ncbi:MAG: FAD-binding oxidoreductase [Acidobacteria bacterium]|nr:FAD-binding oxidoreductase [Acidobacteriota bacterium]
MSPLTDATFAKLEALVDAGNFFTDAESLAHCTIDGCAPRAALHANTVEQVVEVVRFAAAENLAVVPYGTFQQMGLGAPPARYDIALRIGLHRVLSYDPRDLTLSVEAGIQLNFLNRQLREQRQFLPLDSHFGGFATIGGILATNSSGPLRHAFGTARDFLLGLEFVTGEGVRTKSGGRVVKSVAGYDIHKLMIGSLGTLGIITSANFRTFPLPPVTATYLVRFATLDDALAFRSAMAASPLQPRALDILSPEAARLLNSLAPSGAREFSEEEILQIMEQESKARRERGEPETFGMTFRSPAPGFSEKEWTVLVGTGGNEQVVERHRRELEPMAHAARATAFAQARPQHPLFARIGEDDCMEWSYVRTFPSVAFHLKPAAAVMKINVLPGQFSEFVKAAGEIAARHELASAALLRAAGVVYFALVPSSPGEGAQKHLAQACNQIFAAAQRAGGSPVIEFCPAALKREVGVWGPSRGDLALMRNLKNEFDPRGILSPGRFYGGI